MTAKIRILIADDHAIVRMGLKAVFAFESHIDVVAEAGTAAETLAAFERHCPDVVLLDLRMPGDGLVALNSILQHTPSARVLVLTTSELEEDIHRALNAGARGYALKSAPPENLMEAIEVVYAGGRWLPLEVSRKLAERAASEELSARELEVLSLVVKGLTNAEIAAALQISLGTAKAHLRAIISKLQVSDRTEATAEAYRRGLIL